jgi:hypothetical protein
MKIWLLLLFFSVSARAQSTSPTDINHTGWESGNAGDTYAAEFRLTAKDVVQRLELLYQNSKPVIDIAALKAAVGPSTTVVSEDHVLLNGEEVDAANFPKQHLIKVNRSRWKDLRRSTETKSRLRVSLHEFLFIASVDDTAFVVSDHLIELLDIGNYSPDIWWNPVNPANYVITGLNYGPTDCSLASARLNVLNSDETVVLETAGHCSDAAYRKVKIVKTAGVIPASSHVRGLFHQYWITVFDRNQNKLSEMQFEPTWGQCLLPDSGSCALSGKMTVAGVELAFWFLRE